MLYEEPINLFDEDDESYLVNYKNYYVYADAIRNRENKISVYVPDINVTNIEDHIDGICAILKDGIDEDYIHDLRIEITWGGDISCELLIIDYWYNLFMWSMVVKTSTHIKPKHIFFSEELKRYDIKNYVDNHILTIENKIKFTNSELNNIICEGLWYFSRIEQFGMYLANTINNEDDINMMNTVPEYRDLMHISLAGTPLEEVKDAGMDATYKIIDYIKNSKEHIGYNHGLTNSFRASEAINPRQFKEARVHLGTKPNGAGGIFPNIIDKSFTTGGVNDPVSYYIESNTARVAQVLSKNNVGHSGDFARLLGINNSDTILINNPDYMCNTKNYITFTVKSKKHLSMIKNRYYKMKPNGAQHKINHLTDEHLIGQTILLRSPITCSSRSHGMGICKACYGDLYYTNRDINIGKYAAENLSSILTQILLSAKHLLETRIVSIKWLDNFFDYFELDINSIKLVENENINYKGMYMVIDPEDIILVNDEEDAISYDSEDQEYNIDDNGNYNEYVTRFSIVFPNGESIILGSQDNDNLYISNELNEIIRKKAEAIDDKVYIKLTDLIDNPLFYVKIANNEISKTMDDIINTINKSAVTEELTKSEAFQRLVDLIIEGNIGIDAVHLEIILANQVVSVNDVLQRPNWDIPNVPYKLLTLDHALANNPSVVISLLYKNTHKVLYNPLTYKKKGTSFFDLFFCEQPQQYMSDDLYTETVNITDPEIGIQMCHIDTNK